MGVIYKITSPRQRIYIGQCLNWNSRLGDYKGLRCKGQKILYASLKKYGFNAHLFEIIEHDVPDDKLGEREIYWIDACDSYVWNNPKGMNMTIGGIGKRGSWMWNKKLRQRMSEKFSGENNPFFGKKHSEENKRAQSERARAHNLMTGKQIPEWGVEKGREKIRKQILQYSSNGIFLKEYNSIIDAENELNIDHSSINLVCNGKRTHACGYIFKYKSDNYPLKIEVGELKQQAVKKEVICIFKGKTMEFEGPEEAAKATGVPITTIRRAAAYNHGKPIRTGHIFNYKT